MGIDVARRHLTVLGGGIKGTAVAALARLSDMDVTLVERTAVGAGSSSTNHGRLHAGTASWRKDPISLMARRAQAASLMVDLLDLGQTDRPGLYVFEDSDVADDFRQKTRLAGINVSEGSTADLDPAWVQVNKASVVFEVGEYGFAPAEVAARLWATSKNHGAHLVIASAAEVCVKGDAIVTRLHGGGEIASDVVVNTLGRWCSLLEVPSGFSKLDVEWFRWRLLCVPEAAIAANPLDRVLVFTHRDGVAASAIPHGDWVTLDSHDTPLERVIDPDPSTRDWQPVAQGDEVDRDNLLNAARTFPAIGKRLGEDFSCFSLAGIHARRRNSPPGSTNEIFAADRRYLLPFGWAGQHGNLGRA